MPELIEPGTVWLVGAGPGDPDLLTRKAERLINAADVIFYDALVGPAILDLIPEQTARINVGKRSGHHSKDQASINNLIVAAALTGKRVVRLKGGDPSIFGRSTEELEACVSAGVRVSICPGITAASAAAADAGVSLTLRGRARKLVFVTAHAKAGETLDLDWKALADPQSTLAIYMGRSNAGIVAEKLIENGLPASTPILASADASLKGSTYVSTRLDLLSLACQSLGNRPVVILVGAAVGSCRANERTGSASHATGCNRSTRHTIEPVLKAHCRSK